MLGSIPSRTALALVALTCLVPVACTGKSGSSATTQSTPETVSTNPAVKELPVIDQIPAAVAALEAKLGGPQRYFEINATPKLVNLFVALNNGAIAQPWVYVDGVLTSKEGQAASGGTFVATSIAFDPTLVLSTVRSKLPGATLDSFYIMGDGKGNVEYGVLVTSAQGGGLEVVLGPKGDVKSVTPVN